MKHRECCILKLSQSMCNPQKYLCRDLWPCFYLRLTSLIYSIISKGFSASNSLGVLDICPVPSPFLSFALVIVNKSIPPLFQERMGQFSALLSTDHPDDFSDQNFLPRTPLPYICTYIPPP